MNGDKHGRRSALCRCAVALVTAGAMVAFGVTAAFGAATDPFEPHAWVALSTGGDSARPAEAGKPADLEVAFRQGQPSCPPPAPELFRCERRFFSAEQNLKTVRNDIDSGAVLLDVNATPQTCDPSRLYQPSADGGDWYRVWSCDPASYLGTVEIKTGLCLGGPGEEDVVRCSGPEGVALQGPGSVFNGRPRPDLVPGEVARLIITWPGRGTDPVTDVALVKAEASVQVRGPDLGLRIVADDIPDFVLPERCRADDLDETHTHCRVPVLSPLAVLGAQPFELALRFSSAEVGGGPYGHPLITSDSSCRPQRWGFGFTGWGRNTVDPPSVLSSQPTWVLASGTGSSKPREVTTKTYGCERIPYAPKLDLSLDDRRSDQAPAIEASVSQPWPASDELVDEQTTKKATVTFAGFKVNAKNTATHCSEADLQARSCPESSRIGTVSAKSRLLQTGQAFSGNIYLAGLSSDSVKIAALLSGRVQRGAAPTHVRIDGDGRLLRDGRLETTFDNLPPVPISEFRLSLEGGEKGLLRTPKTCGGRMVTSQFESHGGKVVEAQHPVRIAGCGDPVLSAELTRARPGSLTGLVLDVHGSAAGADAIKSVELGLPAGLRWGIGKARSRARRSRAAGAGKRPRRPRRKTGSAGTVSFTTESGSVVTALGARREGRSVRFTPISPKAPSGVVAGSALSDFSALLTRRRSARTRSGGPSRLGLSGIPGNETTSAELSLRSRRGGFRLRIPRTCCGQVLRFRARVALADGRVVTLTDKAFVRGTGRRAGKTRKRRHNG